MNQNSQINTLRSQILKNRNEIKSLNILKNNTQKIINQVTCSCKKKPLENKIKYINNRINFLNFKISQLNNQIIKNQNANNKKYNNNFKALIIGINYNNSVRNKLYGCINDAKDIKNLLINKFKFQNRNIKLLIDEPNNIQPTKKNIINQIRNFISTSNPNDKLWFFYSGHGLQVIDRNRDEKDRKDETLISSDFKIIRDDFLFAMFSKLNPRTQLFCLMDLCHSATIGDLQYTYINLGKPLRNNLRNITNKNITMISSSKDNQLSYDSYIKNKYQGILTFTFLKFIKPKIHLKSLVSLMRNFIKNNLKVNQETILSSSYFLRPGKNLLPF